MRSRPSRRLAPLCMVWGLGGSSRHALLCHYMRVGPIRAASASCGIHPAVPVHPLPRVGGSTPQGRGEGPHAIITSGPHSGGLLASADANDAPAFKLGYRDTEMLDKLAAIEQRYEELGREMARPELTGDYERLQALAREHSSLEDAVSMYRELRRLHEALDGARGIVEEGGDPELVAYAREEIEQTEAAIEALEEKLRLALLPKG